MAEFVLTRKTKLQELPICDNFMFQQVMKNKVICQKFLEEVLRIKIAKLDYIGTEKQFDNLPDSKSIRMDLYVEDSLGKVYDIEMQSSDMAGDALAKRMRYYNSMLDAQIMGKGDDYSKLPETVLIVVCTFDHYKLGRGIYTFKTVCQEEPQLEMGNGVTVIVLNSKGSREGMSAGLKAFLDYVNGAEPRGQFVQEVHAEVLKVREKRELEAEFMTYRGSYADARIIGREEGIGIGVVKGREEGKAEEKTNTALGMLKDRMAVALIMKYTHLSLEKIQELAKSIGVAVVM